MILEQIEEMANYDHKYLKEVVDRIKIIDVKNMTITTNYNKYKITNFALNQLLLRLNIKVPYNYINNNFDINRSIGLWNFSSNKGKFVMDFDEFRNKIVNSDGSIEDHKKIWKKLYYKDIGYRKVQEILNDILELGIRNKNMNTIKLIYDSNKNIIKGVVGKDYKYTSNKYVLDASKEFYKTDIDPRFSFYDDEYGMNLFYKENKSYKISNELIVFGNNINNGQYGGISLSVSQNATFLECTNGLKLDDIKGVKKSIYHNSKEIIPKFKQYMKQSIKRPVLISIIEDWMKKPPMFNIDDINKENTLKKLRKLLQRFGVSDKVYRESIIEILKKEKRNINSFVLGSAVNNFASNLLEDPYESYSLLNPAYHIMAIQ